MKKMVSMFLVTLCVGFFVTSTFAQDEKQCDGSGKNHKCGKFKGMGRKLMRGLKLNEEQREKVKAIRDKYKDQMKESAKAAEDARKAFRIAATNPETDESTLKALSAAVGDTMFVKVQTRRKMVEEIKTVLTDEQKIKFQENLKKMGEHAKKQCERKRKKHGKGKKGGRGGKGKGKKGDKIENSENED